jgi:HAMP domain-containing protein
MTGEAAHTPVVNQARLSIAFRIALLSWLVAVATLSIFVLVTIPQQKRTFLANLESKANGLAVSLHDVAAGAAINEDYASVVSAAQTLLAGDPDLDFLVIMKNDGFSLVIEQESWRVEDNIDPFWYKRERKSTAGIEEVPIFNKRIFHFAQPFDYSGIQWGWIHVGLSLKGYDQSVAALYRNTVLLAIGCIIFSLLVSLVYAQQIVRPITRLRRLFQQIAEGDLSVRADSGRSDELGSLADSVNIMTDALLRRDRILESVRFAAQQFLQSSHWQDAIVQVLEQNGVAAEISRASVFKNFLDENGKLYVSQMYSWTAESVPEPLNTPHLQDASYERGGFGEWVITLQKNEPITRSLSTMKIGRAHV